MTTVQGWQLDEVASAGRENLDPAHVERYDGKMDSDAEAEVAVLEAAGIGPASTVMEFGPGTGQFTLVAAERFARVIAIDVSPPMLELLGRKLGSSPNVELVTAGFLSYEHAGPQVDAIYTRYALHHLPDFWKALALRRMRSMLRDGGVLRLWDVVYDFDADDAPDRLEAWCATGGTSVDGEWSRAEIEEHIRDEHSTFAWLLDAVIERAGFTIENVERDGFDSKYLLRAV